MVLALDNLQEPQNELGLCEEEIVEIQSKVETNLSVQENSTNEGYIQLRTSKRRKLKRKRNENEDQNKAIPYLVDAKEDIIKFNSITSKNMKRGSKKKKHKKQKEEPVSVPCIESSNFMSTEETKDGDTENKEYNEIEKNEINIIKENVSNERNSFPKNLKNNSKENKETEETFDQISISTQDSVQKKSINIINDNDNKSNEENAYQRDPQIINTELGVEVISADQKKNNRSKNNVTQENRKSNTYSGKLKNTKKVEKHKNNSTKRKIIQKKSSYSKKSEIKKTVKNISKHKQKKSPQSEPYTKIQEEHAKSSNISKIKKKNVSINQNLKKRKNICSKKVKIIEPSKTSTQIKKKKRTESDVKKLIPLKTVASNQMKKPLSKSVNIRNAENTKIVETINNVENINMVESVEKVKNVKKTKKRRNVKNMKNKENAMGSQKAPEDVYKKKIEIDLLRDSSIMSTIEKKINDENEEKYIEQVEQYTEHSIKGIKIRDNTCICKFKDKLSKTHKFIFPLYKIGPPKLAKQRAFTLIIHTHFCMCCQRGILCNYVQNYIQHYIF